MSDQTVKLKNRIILLEMVLEGVMGRGTQGTHGAQAGRVLLSAFSDPRIYLYSQPIGGMWYSVAVTEDGEIIAHHSSSDEGFAFHDMTTDDKLSLYWNKYPDGFSLEWVSESKEEWPTGFRRAMVAVEKKEAGKGDLE